ncbi:unnamed protein product [Orchesella dallaii]|uniref:Beta/gamma crystallin 'Greek key' domain-containing protein n=1 Tax=Orchesella dallaii TaxID=48710 RepID=A0ABP1QQK7_9HEXA
MSFEIRTTFLLAIVLLVVVSSFAAVITVYDDVHGSGASYNVEISPGHCTNLPGHWNDRISSINTHGHCAIGYEHGHCSGRGERFSPGTPHHGYLPNLGFNDAITSFKQC